jgi:hypothetical protein
MVSAICKKGCLLSFLATVHLDGKVRSGEIKDMNVQLMYKNRTNIFRRSMRAKLAEPDTGIPSLCAWPVEGGGSFEYALVAMY